MVQEQDSRHAADCTNLWGIDHCSCWDRNIDSGSVVYLIGSLKNERIREVAKALRQAGLEVFDDWHAAGPEADDIWQKYEQERGRKYLEAIDGHHANMVFDFDVAHLDRADVVVLVLPAGKSAHMEFGWAIGQGKRGYILLEAEDPTRWDVMYKFATGMTSSVEGLIKMIGEGASSGNG